jgi:hypothetical protein
MFRASEDIADLAGAVAFSELVIQPEIEKTSKKHTNQIPINYRNGLIILLTIL